MTLELLSPLVLIMVTGLSDRCRLIVQLASEPLPFFTVPLLPVLAAVLSVFCAATSFLGSLSANVLVFIGF